MEKTSQTPWTQFMDMHSGGGQKLDWAYIYIQAPEQKAKIIFYNRFHRNPDRVTCTCCVEDYSTTESPTLEQATAYNRGCAFVGNKYIEKWSGRSWDKYMTLNQYLKDDSILVIRESDIKRSERSGELPEEGYIWKE